MKPSSVRRTVEPEFGPGTGTRPRLSADQRYESAYLFGAICPMRGTGAALMMPFANTDAMQMHLEEISRCVAARAHAVVLMDRAGWHETNKLRVPKNLTIILLPSRAPELIRSRTSAVFPSELALVLMPRAHAR